MMIRLAAAAALATLLPLAARADGPVVDLAPPVGTSTTPGGPRLVRLARPDFEPLVIVASPPAPSAVYYGYQTVLVRVAGVGFLGLAAAVSESSAGASAVFSVTGAAVFLVGPPVVHALRGQWTNLGLGLAGQLVLSALGIGIGVAAASDDYGWGAIAGGGLGFLGAQVVLVVLDATILGFEHDAPPPETLAVVPALGASREGTPTLGLALTF